MQANIKYNIMQQVQALQLLKNITQGASIATYDELMETLAH